eukprot:496801-Prorocentrum_minimum.AAC.1
MKVVGPAVGRLNHPPVLLFARAAKRKAAAGFGDRSRSSPLSVGATAAVTDRSQLSSRSSGCGGDLMVAI